MARPKRHTFRTLNNKTDPAYLGDDEMSVAENVDLDNQGGFRRRKGRTSVATLTDPHSFWAAPDSSVALYGHSSTLKRFWADESSTSLLTLSNDSTLSFQKVNNLVVFSNGTDIGYVLDGVASLLTTPSEQFKVATAAGKFIALYNGRLFVLNDDGLYYTDPYTIDQMDERNSLIPLLGTPTMLLALDSGLWAGKGDKAIWLGGGNPEEFIYKDHEGQVIAGTGVAHVTPERFGLNVLGKFALWVSSLGVCLGTDSGAMQVLTEDSLAVGSALSGAGIIRKENGLAHYVSVLHDATESPDKFTPATIGVDIQTTNG